VSIHNDIARAILKDFKIFPYIFFDILWFTTIKLFEIGREFGKYPIDIRNIDKRIEEEKGYLGK